MKLSFLIDGAGFKAERLESKCVVTLEDGSITTSHITLNAKIEGIDKAKFDEVVAEAEKTCPISKSINAKISVDATLN
jgi:osmotically inducible protein OsmC